MNFNGMNTCLKIGVASLCSLFLAACSTFVPGEHPVSTLYCDNYLIYDMCATDLNRDGQVDLVYFTDTMDVFMYRDNEVERIPGHLGLHRCAMQMDEDLVATTSKLFYITEQTTALEKNDIKGAMLLKYMTYMPTVTECNLRAQQAGATDNV